ncbi:ribonucleases domain containing protein [Babesia divergens]|uniref:Ribonucleases domain containing protein n=1 Tax=Babesia divergens TaxID=32595 RepID=A0AAD9GEA6_BABDI|nr:ribonucleases domain containing protein [Babesia divergens]
MPASSARPDAAQPFGGTVPGDASLLEVVNVKKLIQSRCLDIEELFDSLKRTEKQEMVFQRLPFVLRRRAMSHNPFRVPKGLRLHLATEMSRSVPKCTKRLRKDSRKRLNRLEEYRNRCARNRWLETHLYNAKRFVMGSFWGFRMALRTAQKCRRRCLRYSKRHCIVHDMSYVRVVHVSGRLSDLRQAFSNVFADSSLMFADHYLSGTYRSQAFAYATTETSHRLICPVHFIWIPPRVPPLDSPQTDDVRQIWFFVHPSAVVEFCDTIRDLQHDLECTLLNDFCIFEVMGPISAFLLRAILKVDESLSTGNSLWKKLNPANIDIPPSYVMPLHVLDLNIYGNLRPSFKLGSICRQNFGSEQFLSDAVTSEERHCLCDFKSPNNFAIVNKINVPRLRRRNYSTLVAKLLNTLNVKYPDCKANGSPNGGAPPSLGVTRSVAGSTDTPEHQKRQGYNRVSVASSDTSATNDKCEDSIVHNTSPHVPIWLIRRGDALGGFDVVVPAGTIARKLWIMCNRYGALGIGLEERHMLYAENNQPMFPQDYPDTLAGQRHLRAKES